MHLIGLISDTHGLLRPEVAGIFKGVELIIHACDIGSAGVLEELGSISPVVAVRGNNYTADWARSIPESEVTQVGSILIYTLHDLNTLDLSPSAAGFHVMISGHSHRPSIETRNGVLFVNPGSAGPRRFKLPISVARLTIDGDAISAELVECGKLFQK